MSDLAAQVAAEGWLLKESHGMIRKWDDRYVVLNISSGRILYYADDKKTDLRGEWILNPNSTVKADTVSARPNAFTVTGASTTEVKNTLLRLASTSSDGMLQAIV